MGARGFGRIRIGIAAAAAACGLAAVLAFVSGGSDAKQASASVAKPHLTLIGRFSKPMSVTQAPGDQSRLFVVEQSGKVIVVKSGRVQAKPFLDISRLASCCGERGLLGLAFAPDYNSSHRFYVSYTDVKGDTRIAEYRRSNATSDLADGAHARIVLMQDQPQSNHNGGQITFGPDGKLYIGLGDGGSANDPHGSLGNGQNLTTLLGKILRIDPRASGSSPYTVPADNPFLSVAGARPEIWAYGLRNPWRFGFDRWTGGLAIGDVGQDQVEEIDWSAAPTRGKGLNFGWRPFEGTRVNFPAETADHAVPPVTQYLHGEDGCSVTGGYVVRDARLPAWNGRYLYGDFCSGRVWMASLKEGRLAAKSLGRAPFTVPLLTSFGEDRSGRIYMTSLSGSVYRLDP